MDNVSEMDIHTIVSHSNGLDSKMPIDLPGKAIECPECKAFYPASDWYTIDGDCECCGGHQILFCPVGKFHLFDPYYTKIDKLKIKDI
jgi:hypothetical protein